MATLIHENISFTTSPGELFNIHLDSVFTITRRFSCNAQLDCSRFRCC